MKKKIIICIIVLFMCMGAILGIYCYNKLNKTSYCLEQAYNGIYRISPDEYNSIEKYIRNSNLF